MAAERKVSSAHEGGAPSSLAAEHERCTLAYAAWLGSPERASLRQEMRHRLRARPLACHCRGLPCHAEIVALVANTSGEFDDLLARECDPA